jgi:hypothetical protein
VLKYEFCYKESWDFSSTWQVNGWDVFISAFNSSERVRNVFDQVSAGAKHWFISPEYGYRSDELPPAEQCFVGDGNDEGASIVEFAGQLNCDLSKSRVCVDTTGFMRHHLLILIRHLVELGVHKFDALYSEPLQYAKKEKTVFSDGEVREVKQIPGFEGNHNPDTSNDLLIIGAGYDHPLIAHAAEFKSNAKKIQVLGFPSLRPDMYQENVLQAHKAAEQMGARVGQVDSVFAPANDPFVTASTLARVVDKFARAKPITNLYLCPISTKALTLGFGLYYLSEWSGKNASVILPYTRTYSKQTSEGVGRIWWYRIELA